MASITYDRSSNMGRLYCWKQFISNWLFWCVLSELFLIGSCVSIVKFPNSPTIVRSPQEEQIRLICGASSDFDPNSLRLIWRKDGAVLSINSIVSPIGKNMNMSLDIDGKDYTLVVNSTECAYEGNYRCSIEGGPPLSRNVDVQIGAFNSSNFNYTDTGSGVIGWANDTNPQARLVFKIGSTTVEKNATSNRTCGPVYLYDNELEYKDDTPGSKNAILEVYFPDSASPFITKNCPYIVQIGSETTTVTVESTTTTKSTTGGPVPSPTVSVNDPPPQGCDWKLCIPILLTLLVLALVGGGALTGYCLWINNKCPCKPSSGNVPYEFEIDGVKEDKTIEISPGILIRLAATCYGAKPPASIQWCISYNGKDPMDMTEKDYGNSDALNTSVTTNKRDPKTSDTHSKLEMVPNEDHDGAVIHCVAITKISADEEKWDLKTSPKITLKLKKGQVGDYPGQGGYYQGQGGDYRHQGGDYRGQDGYHQGQGGDNHGQGGNYHRHVGQAGQEYQPHGNTRNDKDPFPQPGKRPNALEPIQGQRTLTPIGDIEKTSFKKKRQTNKQTSEL